MLGQGYLPETRLGQRSCIKDLTIWVYLCPVREPIGVNSPFCRLFWEHKVKGPRSQADARV